MTTIPRRAFLRMMACFIASAMIDTRAVLALKDSYAGMLFPLTFPVTFAAPHVVNTIAKENKITLPVVYK